MAVRRCRSSGACSDPEDVPMCTPPATRCHLAEMVPVAISSQKGTTTAIPNPQAQPPTSLVDSKMMETSKLAETAGVQEAKRPKRSRTGCLTCRTRRRKCDERKPVCQNCISKGFECRYDAAFKILGKNNYTPEVKSGASYEKIRFAGDDNEEQTTRLETSVNSNIESGSRSSPVNLADQRISNNAFSGAGQPQEEGMRDLESHMLSEDDHTFAIHGLLALNSSNRRNPGLPFSSSEEIHEELPAVGLDDIADVHQSLDLNSSGGLAFVETHRGEGWNPPSPSQDTVGVHDSATAESTFIPTFGISSNSATNGTPGTSVDPCKTGNSRSSTTDLVASHDVRSERSALELLKHYRYHIAPWLDICDPSQSFGVEVLGMSTESTAIRDALLKLASASLERSGSLHDQTIADGNGHATTPIDGEQSALLNLMYVLTEIVTDVSKFWLREVDAERGKRLLETMLPQLAIGSTLTSSAYWLLVRLLLSCALMATKPIRISLPFIAENLFRSEGNNSIERCAQDAMALCVDAAMFSQGDEDRWLQQRYGLNRVEVWKMLTQGFAHWYMHRAQEFQPIIELYPKDGVQSDNDFPVIVFTSGAATLANQLYHTGMLLLLQNKPRFADKPSTNHFSMSTLWHAHRICGIAIQNEGMENWDPCLIASLIVAARTATHRSQHTAIIQTLETVQKLTGFNIARHTNELRNEWQLADGW